MPSDNEKISAVLNSLAASVVGAIRGGGADERARLIHTLNGMNAEMPAISEDTADAKEFILALVALLEGRPVGADTLSGAYASIYAGIVEKAMSPEPHADGEAREMRMFLTQMAATVVLTAREGTDEDKRDLAAKLREVSGGLPEGKKDAAGFITALASLLGDSAAAAESLPEPSRNMYRKIRETLKGE